MHQRKDRAQPYTSLRASVKINTNEVLTINNGFRFSLKSWQLIRKEQHNTIRRSNYTILGSKGHFFHSKRTVNALNWKFFKLNNLKKCFISTSRYPTMLHSPLSISHNASLYPFDTPQCLNSSYPTMHHSNLKLSHNALGRHFQPW